VFPIRDTVSRTREPVVVWTIIALNVVAFVYQIGLTAPEQQVFLYRHALVPLRYFNPSWARRVGLSPTDLTPFLTNTFLHGGWLHIISNLWTLYIFGPALEDRLGRLRFAALYGLAGIIASATHAFFNATSPMPVLGASGAIAGIIAAYAVRFPYAWVQVLVPILFIPLFFHIPAMVFAGIWFLTQVMQGTSELFTPLDGGGIAWWAHIGGFASGWLLLHWLDGSSRRTTSRRAWYNGGPWEGGRS
jgi:membrane associated rhomboid family serine protease